ncbi:MAG: rod-binding protein [Candidatus Eiseniibacteriota bacterium]
MFASMLDEKLADAASERMDHGISEALYRQLSRRLPETPAAPAGGEKP